VLSQPEPSKSHQYVIAVMYVGMSAGRIAVWKRSFSRAGTFPVGLGRP